MPAPQGTLQFGPYFADGAFSVSRTASTASDPIQAKFILGVDLPRYAPVVVAYGNYSIVMRDCRAVRQIITSGTNGRWKALQIEDRRWRWRYPVIYGKYNIYLKGQKTSIPSNKKSVQQLATLCLQAMGEQNVDVSLLPSDVYPFTDFDGALASEQLETLIAPFGCVVTLDFNDQARIVKLGAGSQPPSDGRVMDFSKSFEPPVIPETLRVEGAPLLFQRDLPLEPVGYEADTFEVKPLADLSYCPTVSGVKTFAYCDAKFSQIADKKLRELAVSCIWKTYRVQRTNGSALDIPKPFGSQLPANTWKLDLKVATDEHRILPLSSHQLKLWHTEVIATGDKIPTITPAEIIGYFHDHKPSNKNNVDPVPATFDADFFKASQGDYLRTNYKEYIYQFGFSIDEEKNLIKFDKPMYRIKRSVGNVLSPDKHQPAYIVLRTAFQLRDPITWDFIRPFYDYKPGGAYVAQGVTHVLRVPDLEYECGVADARGYNQTPVAVFEAQARFYALKEIAKYAMGDSANIPAKGFLFDYFPDGSISSVRFERSDIGECTSQVDWQSENPTERVTYDEKIKRLAEIAQARFIVEERTRHAKAMARRGLVRR